MISVNTHDAKTRFSALLVAVERDGETVLVCRNGHPVAEIHAVARKRASALPTPDARLAAALNYDPTEPLDAEDLPEDLR
jgi:antitoxin (DNA-binding transcriptional repressor) of toxin-antitoxin stability system